MKITHYAVRDLHKLYPDDEKYPAWDVVAKADDGTIYYTEDIFDTESDAQAFIDRRRLDNADLREYWSEYWEGNVLHVTNNINPDTYDWKEA